MLHRGSRPRKLLSLLAVVAFLILATQTAAAVEVWEKSYGDADSQFFDAAEAGDGYVLVGNTKVEDRDGRGVSSNTVGWIVKTDRSGNVVWQRAFTERRGSSFYGVTSTEDGYVAVGMYGAASLLNLRQAWAVGLSEDGDVRWTSDSFRGRDRFDDVVAARQGGSIAVGTGKGRRQYAVRFDPRGKMVWQSTYGDGNLRSATTTDDGYVFAGKTEKNYGRVESAGVTSVNTDGEVVWSRFYNETSVSFRQGNPGGEDIAALDDGGGNGDEGEEGYAVVSGGTLIRTGPEGEPRWITDVADSIISSVSQHPDGVLTAVKVGDSPGIIGPGEATGRLLWVDETGVLRSSNEGLDGDLGQVREIIPLSEGYYHLSGTGASDSYSHRGYAYVADLQPPEVSLTVTPREGEVGETEFSLRADATDNGEVKYSWDFDGDGTTDSVTNTSTVSRTYTELGEVKTRVTVEDRSGNNDTSAATVETRDTTPPEVGLAAPEPRYVATDAPAVLDAGSSSDNHEVAEYRWDFGDDGNTDRVTGEPRVTHRFSGEAGSTVEMSLTVTDATGNENTTNYSLTVEENEPPSLSVEVEKLSDKKVRLRAHTLDRVGTPEVTWVGPEGETATGNTVTYASSEDGEKVFRVVAEDEYGARNTTNVTAVFGRGSLSDTKGADAGASDEDRVSNGSQEAEEGEPTPLPGFGFVVSVVSLVLFSRFFAVRR